MRYAGLGGQILVALSAAVFAGYHADRWLKISFPILIWLLPVLALIAMFYRLIKETSKNKKNNVEK